ncbi:MAG: sulfatase-like hydrolase/transferase [Candidatus Brocadiia bacterium]
MATDTPNILLIMTDQQRADFSRADGFPLDTTPFIDSLGRRGVRFRRAYTPTPICAPARCSLMTGRFPKANRVRQNWGLDNITAPTNLTEILRERGYSINLVGKNHTYLKPEDFHFIAPYGHRKGGRPGTRTALEKEADEWLSELASGTSLSLEPTPFPLECQHPWRIVRDTIACVDGLDEEPFFLWVSFPEPHNPYQVPEPYFSLFPEGDVPERLAGPEALEEKGPRWRWLHHLIESKCPDYDRHWRRYRANYCGMLRLIDDQVARLLDALEQRGLLENTIVIFTADHGDYVGDYGLQRKGVDMPDSLIRVPLTWCGPGIESGEEPRPEFVSLVDVMPTLCEALDIEPPYGTQGRSLWPMLTGGDYPAEEFRSIYAEVGYGGLFYGEDEWPELHFDYEGVYFDELNAVTLSGNTKMVRMGKWKLYFDMMGRGRLYDVEDDPAELVDRYGDAELAEVRTQLLEELLEWTIRAEDDLPEGKAYKPKRCERNWYRAEKEDENYAG